jgi:hypothetical protein
MKKYYPILLSKKGEVVALQYLKQATKDNISPIIEILDDSLEKKVKITAGSYKTVYKDEFENFLKTHWSFFGNEIILDFSLTTEIERKLEIIEKMVKSLILAGVNVTMSLQMNSSSSYGSLVKNIIANYKTNVCWRTSENSGGFDNFKIAVEKFIPYSGISTDRIILLLDIGYAKADRYNSLRDLATGAIKSLKNKVGEWSAVVVASSSFPENLGDFKKGNNPNRIKRYEWINWLKIRTEEGLTNVKYGDFGTKFPFYVEANFAGTISAKYTTKDDFVIYKGEKTEDHGDGHGQYITHSINIVQSKDYSGKDFSWGDKRIFEISTQDMSSENRKTGSSTTWVQISQNHHIELITSLI